MILGLTFAATLTTGFYTHYFMTKIYESKATILVPKESAGGGAGLAAALAASGAGPLIGNLTGGTNRDTFVAILKSRTLAEDVVERLKLKEYYQTKSTEQAIRRLQGETEISVSREGVVSVKVEDKDPKLAADIANAYVATLDRLFSRMGRTEASRQRAFIEDRREKSEQALRQAEEALRRFQEKNKAVELRQQWLTAIEWVGKLKGEMVAAEVQLEVMRSFATENNPQVMEVRRRIDGLKRQLAQMEYGRDSDLPLKGGNPGQQGREFQVPLVKGPEVWMELVRLTRDAKVQETVFTLLTQQWEQAKITEARDTPTVQPLDRAVPAEQKSKPSTRTNMTIAGVLFLLAGMFLAFFLEYLARIRKQQPAPA